MSRILFASLAACAALIPTNAYAQDAASADKDDSGVYVGVFTGFGSPDQQTFFGHNQAGVLRDIVVDYNNPTTVGVNLGVVAVDGPIGRVRVEGELSYRSSDVQALSLNDVDRVVEPGAKSSTATTFVNAWYDTPKLLGAVRLSAGAGFGLASIDNSIGYEVVNPANTNGIADISIPDSQTTYAYQFMAGAELDVMKSVSIVGDVRHVSFGDYQVQRYILNTPGVLMGNGGTLDSVLDAKWKVTSFTAGIRYKF